VLVNSLRFVSTKAKSPFHTIVGVIEQCGFISTGCLPDQTTIEMDQRQVVSDMVQQIFGQLPYSNKYLLKLKSADGRVLHVRNPEYSEAITTELLQSKLSNENLKFLTEAASPHRQFGAPCTPQSFYNDWSNHLRQDPDIYRLSKKLLRKKHIWCPINRSIVELQKQGQQKFLHWDLDPRIASVGDDELQGKVCFTDGTVVSENPSSIGGKVPPSSCRWEK